MAYGDDKLNTGEVIVVVLKKKKGGVRFFGRKKTISNKLKWYQKLFRGR